MDDPGPGVGNGVLCQETCLFRCDAADRLVLTCIDGSVRDKAFKTLRRWLEGRCEDLEAGEYLRLWKALFYCLWMADKPSYQQNLAVRLGDIWLDLHQRSPAAGIRYARAFWETICREWAGIDRHRLDKYYFLVRRFYLAGFETVFSHQRCDSQQIRAIGKVLMEWPLNPTRGDVPDALRIYLVENLVVIFRAAALSKHAGPLAGDDVQEMFRPFVELVAQNEKKPVMAAFGCMYKELPVELSNTVDVREIGRLCLSRGEVKEVPTKNRQLLYAASQLLQSH